MINLDQWNVKREQLQTLRDTPAEVGAAWNHAHEAMFQIMLDLVDIADELVAQQTGDQNVS